MRCSRVAAVPVCLALATLAAAQTSVRVNIGGPQYTDSNGAVWAADSGCSGGTPFTSGNTITGTSDPTLYQTGQTANNFSCTYSVAGPAFYNVTVRFAETQANISVRNPRIFNVFVNNAFQRTVNIVGSGGLANAATDITFGPIAIYGSSVTVLFASVSNPAEVQAIDIEYQSSIKTNGPFTTYFNGNSIKLDVTPSGQSTLWFCKGDCSIAAPINQFSIFMENDFSLLKIGRYDNTGIIIDDPFTISRANGQAIFNGYGTGGVHCADISPDGISLKNALGNQLAGADCLGEWFVRSEADSYKKKVALNAIATGAPANQANGLDLSSDSGLQYGNQDNLTVGNTYDTGLFRASSGMLKTTCGINDTNYCDQLMRSLNLNPAGVARPTCDVTARGKFWATQGGAGVADTVAVCAKDNMDAYAWRTIY